MYLKRLMAPLCLSLAFGVAACGGEEEASDQANTNTGTTQEQSGTAASQQGPVKIAFSAPGADHGWMAAITE
ncbi:MAG: hypothetical protein M3116_05675, partial [Actinomycetota bacterium]|nr:hypothetical protein [Actinomycetota bacterium]